jgi:hypothetical protein
MVACAVERPAAAVPDSPAIREGTRVVAGDGRALDLLKTLAAPAGPPRRAASAVEHGAAAIPDLAAVGRVARRVLAYQRHARVGSECGPVGGNGTEILRAIGLGRRHGPVGENWSEVVGAIGLRGVPAGKPHGIPPTRREGDDKQGGPASEHAQIPVYLLSAVRAVGIHGDRTAVPE